MTPYMLAELRREREKARTHLKSIDAAMRTMAIEMQQLQDARTYWESQANIPIPGESVPEAAQPKLVRAGGAA